MGLVMMNVAILLNGNRTLTKSCLLFVTLLNVKSSNQSPSSQNEINLTAHTVKMSNHDSYFHLKKKKKKYPSWPPPPPFSLPALCRLCSDPAVLWAQQEDLQQVQGSRPGSTALACPVQIQTRSACDAHLLTFTSPFTLLAFTSSVSCFKQSGYKVLGRLCACAAQSSQ